MDLVSIIIPIYNAEKSLDNCLRSIQTQSYSNFEVFMIDDGSSDSSTSICKSYVEKDSRFKYIRTDNKGVSHARNIGLDNITGKWVGFVDADDYVEPVFLQKLVETALKNNAHIVFCSWFENSSPIQLFEPQKVYIGEDALKLLFTGKYNNSFSVWNKLISKDLIGNVRFQEDLYYLEDGAFCCQLFTNDCRMAIEVEPLYHYVISNYSLSHDSTINYKRLSCITSANIMVGEAKAYSSQLEKVAKANYFRNVCYVLITSYKTGFNKELWHYCIRDLHYLSHFLIISNCSMKTKILYLIYYLILKTDYYGLLRRFI